MTIRINSSDIIESLQDFVKKVTGSEIALQVKEIKIHIEDMTFKLNDNTKIDLIC